jgi:hypothetical protein
MSTDCSLSATDVGVTYRAEHGGMVETSLDRVATGEVLAGPDGAGRRRHVPDILLADASGVTVVDVKAPGKREDPAVRAVMEWTRAVAGLRGWGFEEWHGAGLAIASELIRGCERSVGLRAPLRGAPTKVG